MPGKKIKEILSKDISLWLADGLIDDSIYDVLARRYESERFGIDRVLKYLGIIGGIFCVFGILGLIGAMSGSIVFGIIILLGLAGAFFFQGIKFVKDDLNRYPHSSKALLAAALILYCGAILLLSKALEMSSEQTLLFTGLLWILPAFALSYIFSLSFVLPLALIAAFHWIGSWNSMLGRSTYAFAIQDPRAMTVFAAIAAVIGYFHDNFSDDSRRGFSRIYLSLGLLYFNMSILILSIFDENKIYYVFAGIFFCLLQIVLGSRTGQSVFTGFGVTFLGISLFTRYYELFWNSMDKGAFFLAGGLIILCSGIFFEWYNNKLSKSKKTL